MSKENLYSFKKDSWHCKFYHWAWDTWPHEKFKTMCPYFWTSVGTVLLLPIILLVFGIQKLAQWVSNSKVPHIMSTISNKCEEYNSSRKQAKYERKEAQQEQKQKALFAMYRPELVLALDTYREALNKWSQNIESEELTLARYRAAYNVSNVIVKLGHPDVNEIYKLYYDTDDELWDDVSPKARQQFLEWMDYRYDARDYRNWMKENRLQVLKERFEENPPPKVVTYTLGPIIMVLTTLMGLSIVGTILYGIWALLVLIAVNIVAILSAVAIVAGIVGVAWFLWWSVKTIIRCWGDVIANFCKKLLMVIAWPFIKVGTGLGKIKFWSTIGKGFRIFFGMIYATYKQYCPMITWKE